ncbi:MAG: hypothetical protein LBP32_05070 [Spirochaetaceae bacterium]|jgi:hypothetical protein|nr:hypothetical protein [Spirochaetaceae bacterium]
MRKPVFPRIIGLFALYGVVFIGLVMIQFTRRSGFTHRVGNFVVSGRYGDPAGGENLPDSRGYPLAGGVSVYFGGMEFRLFPGDDTDGLALVLNGGGREALSPEYMVLSGETAVFRLSGGTELAFTTQYSGGTPELRLTGFLNGDAAALELPYRPLRTSRVKDEAGQYSVLSDGVSYGFGRSGIDRERRMLIIGPEDPVASYRAVPDRRAFDPGDFTIPGARDTVRFGELIGRWRDRSFSLWNRLIGAGDDENMVIAYVGESVRRGVYRAAVSAVPGGFLSGGGGTYESSVFLGRLDLGLRSIAAFEREKSSRLSRLINEKSPDLFREFHVIEYLAIRGYGNFINDGAEIARSLDPAALPLDLTPGILEAYSDWIRYRSAEENPFERLIDQACFVISGGMWKNGAGDQVFAGSGERADLEFNFRLGNALMAYGENTGRDEWAGLGRSLVLSVLSLLDESLSVPGAILLSGKVRPDEDTAVPRLSSAALCRFFPPPENYPRAAAVGTANGVWAWTAAGAIQASQTNNVLDISVSFPVGETHYMLIRGIRPFAKIQLHNMDYRTDPQFERYDSSGWSYSAAEQTLLVKMRHRTPVEHIRIFAP